MFKEPTTLSPDLEWMLTSAQAGEAEIRETAAREYSAAMYRLALTLLNSQAAAQEAVQEILESLPTRRHLYSGKAGARNWLFSMVIGACRRTQRAGSLGFGTKTRQVTAHWPEGSPRESEVDRQVWRAVDGLREGLKIPLLLWYVHRLPAEEIAKITGRPERAVKKSLLAARLTLYRRLRGHVCQLQVGETKPGVLARLGTFGPHRRARRLAQALEMTELDALLARSLPARSSPLGRTVPSPEAFLSQVEQRLSRRGKMKGRLSFGLQMIYTGLIAALILGAGWVTNRLFPISAAAPVVHTVQVTRLVPVEATQIAAPTQSPAPQPLSDGSSKEEIRRRMIESTGLWRSVWVDATLFSYGPSGYVGPPQVYRNQMWIEQPERSMVLSGPLDDSPDNIVFKLYDNLYEMDLKTGLTFYYRADEEVYQRLYGPPPAFTNLNGYNPRPLVEGTFVRRLLYPQPIAQDVRSLRVLGSETMLGRQVLIVDATVSEGMPKRLWVGPEFGINEGGSRYLLWIDAETGVSLRQQRFDPTDRWKVVEEVVINAIGFGVDFPEQSYSSYFFSPERFVWENEWIPAQASRQEGVSAWQPPLEEALNWDESGLRRSEEAELLPDSDPGPVDISRSRLTFRWDFTRRSTEGKELAAPYSPEKTAGLFAGRQYLGRAEMGNPWYLVCERSPDGQKLVFNEGWADPFLPTLEVLWLSLDRPQETHRLLAEGSLTGSDVAFSPDSQSVAFWGCGGGERNCGVYVKNLETGKNRKLIESENASYFTWSPDGEYLAMIRLDYSRQSQQAEPRVTVLGLGYGEIVYQEDFDLRTKVIPAGSPTHAWKVVFPPLRTGLEGCIAAPSP